MDKIMKRFLIALTALWTIACGEVQEARIPFRPVYLELDLTFEDKELLGVFSHKIYTSKNLHSAVEKAGFGGVLVFHGEDTGFGPYQAYDIACPFEADGKAVVSVDESGIHAVCPVCKSKYELTAGGFPVPGSAGKYRLQPYTVQQPSSGGIGVKLIVRN